MTSKIHRYYCPLCSEEAEVIQVDDVPGDIGDEEITWKRVHLECRGKCPLLWSCVDIPTECYDGMFPTRRVVVEVDNRDRATTWLWISKSDYVEVNPTDLMNNMLENLPDGS